LFCFYARAAELSINYGSVSSIIFADLVEQECIENYLTFTTSSTLQASGFLEKSALVAGQTIPKVLELRYY
jgi:hypothetical protein